MKDPWVHVFDGDERFSSPRTLAGSGSLFAPGAIDCPRMTGTPSNKIAATGADVDAGCCGTTEWINRFRIARRPKGSHAHRAADFSEPRCSLDQKAMTLRGVLG